MTAAAYISTDTSGKKIWGAFAEHPGFAFRDNEVIRPVFLGLSEEERTVIEQAALRVEGLCQSGSFHHAAALRAILDRFRE